MNNNSWPRIIGIAILALLVIGAVAFVAYRIGFNQGAGYQLGDRPMPPSVFSPRGDWFSSRMHPYDGRDFFPMMNFGWHFFHPGFLLGLMLFVGFVYLLVRAFTPTQAASQEGTKRFSRK
jgi:hypothetical protein